MSLDRFLRDLAVLSLFLGLVFGCVLSVILYTQTKDVNYAVLGFVLGVLAGLMGVAQYIYWREVLQPILDVWRGRRPSKKDKKCLVWFRVNPSRHRMLSGELLTVV